MALFAACWEAHRLVIRRLCCRVLCGVARDALGRQALEVSGGGILMTRVAFDSRVSAHQRKSILVIADVLQRCGPALHRVTTIALCPHLAAVHVSMAVAALVSHISEYGFQVTLRTGHGRVHAAQRVLGFVVIELWLMTNRFPTAEGVAILAGN